MECLWEGEQEVEIYVTNWGMEPIAIPKGAVTGALELVAAGDPIWEEPVDPTVAIVSDGNEQDQQKRVLREEVSIGKEDRAAVLDMILANHCTLALSDQELGETDFVEHNIKLIDCVPITTHPRLPYALCAELEEELERSTRLLCFRTCVS